MSNHDLLHGRNLIIKVNDEPLALSKSCTVDVQCDDIPVSGPTTGQWEDSIPGRKKWEVSCSHLMYNRGATKPLDRLDMVGSVVSLEMDIVYDKTTEFQGFVENVTIESGSVSVNPAFPWIVYDTVHKLFLAEEGGKYYQTWTYSDGSYNPFSYNNVNNNRIYENSQSEDSVGEYYKAVKNSQQQNYDLVRRDTTRQGSAIVKQWSGTFTLGNLATGSYKFKGKGALLPVPDSDDTE